MSQYTGRKRTNLQEFEDWIVERERVRFAKSLAAPPPWSKDPVMQKVYFCNIRREDDKVTKFVRETYANADNPVPFAGQNMMLARMVNKPASLRNLGWPWGAKFHKAKWEECMSPMGVWGNAYIVSTNGRESCKWEYVGGLLAAAWQRNDITSGATTLAEAHGALMAINGLGTFMSAQIVADLKNTVGHPLTNAEDWWTWCAHGPGSLRGLYWVNEDKPASLKEKCTPTEFRHSMPHLLEYINEKLGCVVGKLHAQDLQNCLCEFDKYMRVKNGTGRSKRKYNGV